MLKKYFLLLIVVLSFVNCQKNPIQNLTPEIKNVLSQINNKELNILPNSISKLCDGKNELACEIINKNTKYNIIPKIPITYAAPINGKTVITTLSNDPQLFLILKNSNNEIFYPYKTQSINTNYNDQIIHHFYFEQKSNEEYSVLVFDSKFHLLDKRSISLLNPLEKNNPKLSIVSCMYDGYEKEQKQIWNQLKITSPDLVLFIGDNVYIDSGIYRKLTVPVSQIWKRWVQTRESLEYFYFDKLIPYLAIWDDHDFGQNNGGKYYANKKQAKDAFLAFFPNAESDNISLGPGLSFYIQNDHLDMFFIDNRTFRDTENNNGDHLGEDQLKFFKQSLKSKLNPILVIKGDQFFGGYHKYESYEKDHPHEFQKFMNILTDIQRPIILISGDRHLSEVMKNQNFIEITSSPIHSKVFPDSFLEEKNPNRIWGMGDEFNFINLSFDWEKYIYKIEAIDLKGTIRYSGDFKI